MEIVVQTDKRRFYVKNKKKIWYNIFTSQALFVGIQSFLSFLRNKIWECIIRPVRNQTHSHFIFLRMIFLKNFLKRENII